MSLLILGYGNSHREDDGAGLMLSSLLKRDLRQREEDVELWLGTQLVPELAFDLALASVAVFVDASVTEYPDGYEIQEIFPDKSLSGLNIHSFSPQWLLSLMDNMKLHRPKTVMISITGYSYDFVGRLSPECKENLKKARRDFLSNLDSYLKI